MLRHGRFVFVVSGSDASERGGFSAFARERSGWRPADGERDCVCEQERGQRPVCLPDYGPHKTIYNRFVRWSRLGVFNKIFAELAGKGGKPERIMIDATHLKAHRTAASLLKKGLFPDVSGAPKVV